MKKETVYEGFIGADPQLSAAKTIFTLFFSLCVFSAPLFAGPNSATTADIPSKGIERLVLDEGSPHIAYASGGGGLFKTIDSGISWAEIGPTTGSTNYISVTDIAIDPQTPTTIYGFAFGWPQTFSNVVFKSFDGGANWIIAHAGLPIVDNSLQLSPLAISPIDSKSLIVEAHYSDGSTPARIFKSNSGGTNWIELLSTGLVVRRINNFAFDLSNSNKIFAGTADGLYTSTNAGTNWVKAGFSGGAINSFLLDTTIPGQIFISADTGIFVSADGGITWLQTGPSSYCLAVDRSTPNTIYSGGGEGQIYISTDHGQTFAHLTTFTGPGLQYGLQPTYQLIFAPLTKTVFASNLGVVDAYTFFSPFKVLINSTGVLSWPSQQGISYQIQASSNLATWTNSGIPIVGNGLVQSLTNYLGFNQLFSEF